MRIASVAKAYSGAVALHLVGDGALSLDDTIARRLPGLPTAWAHVTLRRLLNHTSGLPDYTRSPGFAAHARNDPGGYVPPARIIGWVRDEPLVFTPGSRYEYSNTDNIVVGLMAQAVTRKPYGQLLRRIVFGPARLSNTSFPKVIALPRPFIHGYVVDPGAAPEDVSTFLSPSGAWASGAIVSTPADVNTFIRSYLARRFFGRAQQRQQMHFIPAAPSSPPGPGRNAAGLAIFRYRTRCGTVYGHTGNHPVRRRDTGRPPRRHDHAQHPGADRRAAQAPARRPDDRRVRAARQIGHRRSPCQTRRRQRMSPPAAPRRPR